MATILQLDSSARPFGSDVNAHGSHTRRLTGRFIRRWRAANPGDTFLYRDIGASPPAPVTGSWVHAAFTSPADREPWMCAVLQESDSLIDELLSADVIVAGVPMYNFNVPAQFKAYIDNIVRVGRTFGFDRQREGAPYWPLLADQAKTLVLLASRGDYDYGPGQRLEHMNHVERSVITAFGYIGIADVHCLAIEYDEFGDERLRASINEAEAGVDVLVGELARTRRPNRANERRQTVAALGGK